MRTGASCSKSPTLKEVEMKTTDAPVIEKAKPLAGMATEKTTRALKFLLAKPYTKRQKFKLGILSGIGGMIAMKILDWTRSSKKS